VALHYFSILFQKGQIFEQNVSFDFLCNIGLENFSLQEEMSKTWSKMYNGQHVIYPLFLSVLNETNSLNKFSNNTPIYNFMQLHPLEVELFHVDGQTDGRTDRQTKWQKDRKSDMSEQHSLFAILGTRLKRNGFQLRTVAKNIRLSSIEYWWISVKQTSKKLRVLKSFYKTWYLSRP